MQLKLIPYFLGLSIFSLTVYAEPPLQAGDTLESLSKVSIQTSVNGQPGSIQDLVDSGRIQVIQGSEHNPSTTTLESTHSQTSEQSSTPDLLTEPTSPQSNTTIPSNNSPSTSSDAINSEPEVHPAHP